MAYIGNIPAVQYASFSKQTLTADSSTTSFTLDNAVANENEIEVFVNNVRQEPGSGKAYTASGTTLTMSVAPTTGDSFYVIFQGKATQTVTAPAGSVTTSQLADSSVSLAKLTATGTKDSTTFLRGDNTFAEAGGGIEMVDMWRLTADLTNPGTADINANLERADDATSGTIGTGMTESSGVFTFPSTGIYRIQAIGHFYIPGNDGACEVNTLVSSNSGSSYDQVASAISGNQSGGQTYNTHPSECFVDVTNASTFRVKFQVASMSACILVGNSNSNSTSFSFIKLGDT